MFNKEFFNQVIYQHKKTDKNDPQIINKIFEPGLINIFDISSLNYCKQDAKTPHSIANTHIDNLRAGEKYLSDDIYLVCTSSMVYGLLFDGIDIPTKSDQYSDYTYIHICTIEVSDQKSYMKCKEALDVLGFLNLDIMKSVLLADATLTQLKLIPGVIINTISSHKFKCKTIDFEKVSNPLDILSLSKQCQFKKVVHSILTYNSVVASDPSNPDHFDNLQYYLIDQQLRLALYRCLKPLMSNCYVRFNKQKTIVDSTGNLFFRLILPSEILGNFKVGLTEVFLSTIDNGFFISSPNLDGKLTFSEEPLIHPNLDLFEIYSKSATYNILYPLLFKYLMNRYTKEMTDIDDMLIAGAYEDVESYVQGTI